MLVAVDDAFLCLRFPVTEDYANVVKKGSVTSCSLSERRGHVGDTLWAPSCLHPVENDAVYPCRTVWRYTHPMADERTFYFPRILGATGPRVVYWMIARENHVVDRPRGACNRLCHVQEGVVGQEETQVEYPAF